MYIYTSLTLVLYLAVTEAVFFQCPSSADKPFRMGHAFGAQCLLPVPSNASFMQAMHFLSASFSSVFTLHFWLYCTNFSKPNAGFDLSV